NGETIFTGTSGNDTIRAYTSQFDASDKVQLGEGHDTLFVRTTTPNFHTDSLPNVKGVDQIDLTSSTSPGTVKVGNTFLANSDHGEVTINYGSYGLRLLDTSAVDHAKYDVFIYGKGDVFLSDGNDEVTVIKGAQGKVHGGGGDDAIFGDTADDVLY